jgi:hypothetical protein
MEEYRRTPLIPGYGRMPPDVFQPPGQGTPASKALAVPIALTSGMMILAMREERR